MKILRDISVPTSLRRVSCLFGPTNFRSRHRLDIHRVDHLASSVFPTPDNSQLETELPALYNELRELAAGYLRRERPDHTLQPTALVHESYLRLAGQHSVDWGNRLQFLSIAARMMRRILANYAAARKAEKRGSGETLLELDAALEFYDRGALGVAKLEEALSGLEIMDRRQAQVVELRFFGGLTMEETAEVMGISPTTVKREWNTARRWLHRELSDAG